LTTLTQLFQILEDPNVMLRIVTPLRDVPCFGNMAGDFEEGTQEFGIFLNCFISNGIRDSFFLRVAEKLDIDWEKLKTAELKVGRELINEWLEAKGLSPIEEKKKKLDWHTFDFHTVDEEGEIF